MPANQFYSFHLFIRTRQSGIKLLSGKIIVLKRIHVIKEERKIKLLNPFFAEDEDEEQEIRIVKRVEDYYPEDKFSARYEIKVTKQSLYVSERGKPEYPGKNLSEQKREPTTNSTHIWRRRRDVNPGHTGGRRMLSPLRHYCLRPFTFAKQVKRNEAEQTGFR